ncbi:MAG: hypothetical protein SFW67_34780, partial [Myxococcaceae bacterium]|nr:hypothetical protein [Myxococcaceae bacterium]
AGGNTAGGNTAGGNTAGGNTAGGNTAGGNTAGGNTAGGNTAGGSAGGGTAGPQPVIITFSKTLDGAAQIDFTTSDTIHGRISGLGSVGALGCIQPVGTTGCQGANAPFQSLTMSGWSWDAGRQLWRIQYPPGTFPQGWFEGFARNASTQVTSALTRIVVGVPSGTSGVCASVPRPPGWTRSTAQTSVSQIEWVQIPGTFWNPVPHSGGSGRVVTTHGEYLSLQFTMPVDPAACASAQSKLFQWDPSQVDGEADMSRTYVTLSQCPGDFRFPTEAPAPATDPTYARGCRNFRRSPGSQPSVRSNIAYRVGTGPSDEYACELACGQTYFINFVRANPDFVGLRSPSDEVDPGFSSNCNTVHPQVTRCGVQMRYF